MGNQAKKIASQVPEPSKGLASSGHAGLQPLFPMPPGSPTGPQPLPTSDHGPAKEKAPITREEAIKSLAQLDAATYDGVRKEIAKKQNIRVSTLDKEVKAARMELCQDNPSPFTIDDPWDEPVLGYQLLDEIETLIGRFIVCTQETMVAIALWVAMTWFVAVVEICPLAVITAPEKRCGKSLLLILISKLVFRPLLASNISSPALFRSIDAWGPTLLLDEADTFMKENEEMRGVINSGHTKETAFVIRLVGDNHTPKSFCTFGAKAVAGIGKLPDTVMDRSIIINLRRKKENEKVERLRRASPALFSDLRSRLARFVEDYGENVYISEPELPDELNDRAQDNWEPLLAIADAVGGDWPKKARAAALTLSGVEDPTTTVGTDLLADIKDIFHHRKFQSIRTQDLLSSLCTDPQKRWKTYNRGSWISPRQVSTRLAEYGIKSKDIRFHDGVFKGYDWADFIETCDRYLPQETAAEVDKPSTEPVVDFTKISFM